MKVLLNLVVLVSVNLVLGDKTDKNIYKAAVVVSKEDAQLSSVIQEAGELNVDILLLPSPKSFAADSFAGPDGYDEIIKTISKAARKASLYITTHMLERTRCQNKEELIRSNLVFDRRGDIVAIYRKPMNAAANCTTTTPAPRFTTDFGVTFGLLMKEDLVLLKPEDLKLKNFVVVGEPKSDIPFLSGPQFSSSWAYVTNANLVTSTSMYLGKAGVEPGDGRLIVADLNKDGGLASPTWSTPMQLASFPGEDLSQYIIKPLDLEASSRGYKQSLCHGKFCCEFFVKTCSLGSKKSEVSFGLAVFNGVRHFTQGHNIGTQTCAMTACAGLYKRTCALGPNNSTNIIFEKITITGNFAKINSAQFPVITTTSESQDIQFETKPLGNSNKVTINVANGKNVLSFGIFGRVFSKDFQEEFTSNFNRNQEDTTYNYYDYFFNDDVQEVFDYLWIRLRILFFVVSIYVLEMM